MSATRWRNWARATAPNWSSSPTRPGWSGVAHKHQRWAILPAPPATPGPLLPQGHGLRPLRLLRLLLSQDGTGTGARTYDDDGRQVRGVGHPVRDVQVH